MLRRPVIAAALALLVCASAIADDRSVVVRTDKSAVAITATATGTAWLCERYTEAVVYLWISAVSGTPTLDLTVQTGPDDGSSSPTLFSTHTSFAQQTGVTTTALQVRVTNLGKYLRLLYTVGGGSPSLTVTTKIVFKT